MIEIQITSINSIEVLETLAIKLHGEIQEQWGEHVLTFDNEIGKGTIRFVDFDWGVSLMDYNVHFEKGIKICFKTGKYNSIEFIFVSEGQLDYVSATDIKHTFERYQNVIISNKTDEPKAYVFPSKTVTKVNFIGLQPKEYALKKNHNLSYLSNNLLDVFDEKKVNKVYKHFGDFNLKIADRIRHLNENHESGIVRTLSIEGQLNLIMAMQILEQQNYEKGRVLPDSLSKDDIKKIHKLVAYIVDNIAEPISVGSLAEQVGFSTKKLQMGFRVLYDKSVNEYLRQLKLEIARDSICNTNATISEIVYKIGFRNRSYFSKIFFKHYGILPTEYRKKMLKNQRNK